MNRIADELRRRQEERNNPPAPSTTPMYTGNKIEGKLSRERKIAQQQGLRDSAGSYGMLQGQVQDRVYGNNTPGQNLHGSGTKVYEQHINKYFNTGAGAKGAYSGRGLAKEGQTLNGKTVIDTNKLGLKFNIKTGKMDKVNNRSGFNITATQYQSGTTSEGDPIYSYAPTITRKAYNAPLGKMIGTGGPTDGSKINTDGENSVESGDDTSMNNANTSSPNARDFSPKDNGYADPSTFQTPTFEQITYTDENGNKVTEDKKPSYTKEGARQRSLQRKEKSDTIKAANEVVKWQNEGKNLFDWLEQYKGNDNIDITEKMAEWNKAQKYLAEKQGRFYEAPDTNDATVWAELNENSQTGELAKAKRTRDEALEKINKGVEFAVARAMSAEGELDPATRKTMEDQLRAKIMNNSKTTQAIEKVNTDYNKWKQDNQMKIGANDLAGYRRIQAAAAKSKEDAIKEQKLIKAEKKALADLTELYPDQEFTDEQISAFAKSTLSADPAEKQLGMDIAKLEAEGKLTKNNQVAASMSLFDTPADAQKYWKKRLPTWEVNKQMEKYYKKEMGLSKEEADAKLEMSDLFAVRTGEMELDSLSEKNQKAYANLATDAPSKYFTLEFLAAEEKAMQENNGRGLTEAEKNNAIMKATAKYNKTQGELAEEIRDEDPYKVMDKLYRTDRAMFRKRINQGKALIDKLAPTNYDDYLSKTLDLPTNEDDFYDKFRSRDAMGKPTKIEDDVNRAVYYLFETQGYSAGDDTPNTQSGKTIQKKQKKQEEDEPGIFDKIKSWFSGEDDEEDTESESPAAESTRFTDEQYMSF